MSDTKLTGSSPAPREGGTVLIVDDEAPIRSALSRFMHRTGFETIEAADGSEAIHLFADNSRNIVAVLLDLAMPNTNGRETLAMLRACSPNLPVVIVTAFAPTADLVPQPGDRGIGFVQKPFSSEDLVAELKRVIAECA